MFVHQQPVHQRDDHRHGQADHHPQLQRCSTCSTRRRCGSSIAHELGHALSGHAVYRTLLLPADARSAASQLGARRRARRARDHGRAVRVAAQVRAVRRPGRAAGHPGPGDGVPGAHEARHAAPATCPSSTRRRSSRRARSTSTPPTCATRCSSCCSSSEQAHPFAVVRAAELRRWVDSGEYTQILGGTYPRRDEDAGAKHVGRRQGGGGQLHRGVPRPRRTRSASWSTTWPASSAAPSSGSTSSCAATATDDRGWSPAREPPDAGCANSATPSRRRAPKGSRCSTPPTRRILHARTSPWPRDRPDLGSDRRHHPAPRQLRLLLAGRSLLDRRPGHAQGPGRRRSGDALARPDPGRGGPGGDEAGERHAGGAVLRLRRRRADLVPLPSAPTSEAHKTEPDKNTYLVLARAARGGPGLRLRHPLPLPGPRVRAPPATSPASTWTPTLRTGSPCSPLPTSTARTSPTSTAPPGTRSHAGCS